MANELGTAYLSLMPSMKGFKAATEAGLSGVNLGGAGQKMGGGLINGMKTSLSMGSAMLTGAVAGIASSAASTLMSSMGAGIARADIINNFPKVMSNFKISSDDSSAAINKLSESLRGLPTGLDQATSGVQRLVSKNSDIGRSTDLYLAMNNAILAGGATMDIQRSAAEQLTQAYAKGKMDMMEWRTVSMAMPGQLNQVAQAMGMTTEQLSAGLRRNDKDVSYFRDVTMDEFMDTIARLNTEGVDGFQTFEEQARNATGGVQTSMENVKNAMSRFWQDIINSIGSERIQGFASQLSSALDGAGDAISSFLTNNIPVILEFFGSIKDSASKIIETVSGVGMQAAKPVTDFLSGVVTKSRDLLAYIAKDSSTTIAAIGGITGALVGLKIILPTLNGLQAGLKGTAAAGKTLAGAFGLGTSAFMGAMRAGDGMTASLGKAGSAFKEASAGAKALSGITGALKGGIVMLGTALAGMAIAAVIEHFETLKKRQENLKKASEDLAPALRGVGGAQEESARRISASLPSIRRLREETDKQIESQVALKESIKESFAGANADIKVVNGYVDAIKELAGKSNLTADEQARLKIAVDKYNEATGNTIGIVDQLNGRLDTSIERILRQKNAWEGNTLLQAGLEAKSDVDIDIAKKEAELKRLEEDISLEHGKLPKMNDSLLSVMPGEDFLTTEKSRHEKYIEGLSEQANSLRDQIAELNRDSASLAASNEELVAELAKSVATIEDTIVSIVGSSEMLAGIDMVAFSDALSKAGVSSENLVALSSENIKTLAEAWKEGESSMVTSAVNLGVLPQTIGNAFKQGTPDVVAAMELFKKTGIEDPLSDIEGFADLSIGKGMDAMISTIEMNKEYIAQATGMTVDEIDKELSRIKDLMPDRAGAAVRATRDVLAKAEGIKAAASQIPKAADAGARSIDGSGSAANFIGGFLKGLSESSALNRVRSFARDIGVIAAAGLNSGIEAKSPSRLTALSGDYFVQGFTNSILYGMPKTQKAAKKFGSSAVDMLASTARGLGDIVPSVFSYESNFGGSANTSTTQSHQGKQAAQYDNLTPKLELLIDKISSLQVVLNNGVLVGELAPMMDASLNRHQTIAQRGL